MKAIDNEELRKIIEENPGLPLVFEVYNDNVCFDYGCTVFEACRSRVGTVWFDEQHSDGRMYDDKDDVIDDFRYKYCDDEKYKDLSDEEFDKAMEELVEEEVRHYEAIIVRVG